MTPPTLAMLSHPDETQITDGAVFTGTVSDDHAAVVSVDYAFVDAATALETEKTLLDLPFNDLPETVLFRNNASEPTRIFCLDESCPTSGAPGNDGTAASFDGVDDLLRSFEVLDLPESGVTTALWFKTTCADCGLFSTIAGQFPTQTGHDRDLYLAAGKVCVDVQVGAGAETRCTVADNNADGQWHQVVHSLGAGGNALYLDGALAVSSPTTASTFTAQDRVLAGYAAAAASPYLNGALDDVIIYEGQLSDTSIAALYRRWQPAVLANGNSQWSFTVPEGLEGYYQIDMRATDSAGNRTESRGEWPQFRGPVDTGFPTFDLNVAYSGYGSAAQTTFSSFVRDANLTTDDYGFVCPLAGDQLRYETDPIQLQYTNQPDDKLTGIEAVCVESGFQNSQVSARACDLFGHCAAGSPPQTVAYIGTRYNTLTPAGSLPNAIERTVLSDPQHRVRIIERPGQIVTDIAVDTSRGKLYWGEMRRGDYAQPAQIMRANLDGSDPQVLVSGLTAYAPEALQIAIDPVGNKLYWIKGAELWWSNLDGTLPQVIYTIDRAVVGVSRLGDLVVDGENGRLYFAENRRHGTLADYNAAQAANVNYIPFHGRKHTLIVTTNLNGTAPEFFAGVGPGCTYANFYDNQGTGSGPGLQPTICLISGTDGFDVESMTFSNNTLYWTAFDAAGVNSAAYGRVPGSPAFTVAPLELTGNSQGLRTEPLPTMYVAPGSIGVYVAVGDQVVRGEPGGEFSLFSSFRDDSPPPATGVFIRKRSDLTAMAVVRTPQTVQTKADLAVDITSPDLVLLNGDTGRYDLQIANNSGLPADNTTLTLTLPDAGSFAGASQPCAAAGTTVTCDLGRLDPYSQQTLAISFIVSTVDVATLTATAVVSSAFADANAADNSASHTGITAAPTLAALPGGVPYIYASSADHFVRIPLIGDHTPEPVLLDNNGLGGNIIASDVAGGKLFISNVLWKIAAVNPNGTGYGVIGDANSNAMVTQDSRLSVAVDEVGGRVYWSDIVSLYLTKIQSANLDGSDVQTVVPQVVNQRGIVVDTVRRKLLWVGNDLTQSQNIIFRSNLDGSEVEIAYSAPAGRLINYLAIDPYAQKLYWIDSAYNGGALFWADSDGQNVAVLHEYLGANARGTVVVPQQNSIYFTSGNAIARSDLNGDNYEELAWLDGQRYTGVSNLDPTAFPWLFFNHPDSNLVLAFGAPFAPPACTGADGNEPNDSAAAATVVGTGTFTAALCRSTSADGPADQDVYRVTVPSGQQVEVTLDPPADYNLYLQLGDFTADVSTETGTTQDSVSAANYSGADQQYTVTVYAPSPTNSPALYTVGVALSAAPPQTVFTNDQCLAVDPLDVPAPTGNGSPATATPLTVGQAVTAALCYQDDVDYYSFNGAAGQTLSVDLPVRPADYGIYVYRPNGSLFNAYSATGVWTYGTPFTLDASGAWKVAVLDVNLAETLSQYQLLVSDLSCQLNDSYEPNNAASQAADISGQSRVFATLCSAADQDYYQFSATAGQQLTINYPADGAGGNLVLQNSAGAALGQVTPGTQGTFLLANAGTYRLLAASSTLSGSDVPYMFQWSLATPPAASTDTRYVYYADYPHFIRVALSNDHSVEGLLIDGGASSGALTASTALGKLFFVDSVSDSLVSLDFSGNNRTVIIPDANPDNVGVTAINVAVDDLGGRVYWIQPRGAAASTAADLKSATLNGGDVQTVAADVYNQRSLLIDRIKGLLYWVAGDEIRRSRLGSNPELVRAAVPGEQVRFSPRPVCPEALLARSQPADPVAGQQRRQRQHCADHRAGRGRARAGGAAAGQRAVLQQRHVDVPRHAERQRPCQHRIAQRNLPGAQQSRPQRIRRHSHRHTRLQPGPGAGLAAGQPV
ncbi:MAG: LamG-like jellyroll fold domain-containing protein [Caldilineales bacterium]